MSGDRCWSSIVATPDERVALALSPAAEWLIGCVLPAGHPGAHASDGDQPHHGRRRWLVWGDFARGAQTVRDEDPCPVTELDGSACLFYFGHSGPHRFVPVPPAGQVSQSSPPQSFQPQSSQPQSSQPQSFQPQSFPSQSSPSPSPPPQFPRRQPAAQSPLDRRPAAATGEAQPRHRQSDARAQAAPTPTGPGASGLSAYDLDPDPPTESFAPLPTPPGWPNAPAAPQARPLDSRSAMDDLFDGLPSLKPEDAPTVRPTDDWATFVAPTPAASTPIASTPIASTPVASTPVAPETGSSPDVEHHEVLDVEVVELDEADTVAPNVAPPPVEEHLGRGPSEADHRAWPDDYVARHAEPPIDEPQPPVTRGPAHFVPADGRSGKKQKHRRKKIDNTYEPSLGEDAPGGATTVVFRDDPSASVMEVRPASDDVLTTSILQVIASNDDPLRMGVPTTRSMAIEPRRQAALASGEPLTDDDYRAMTATVRNAAARLADESSDDAHALGDALRDLASTLAELSARLPE